MEQIDLAIELAQRGEFWPAIHLYEEALIRAEEQGDLKSQFNALNGLSNVANLITSPAMARACLLRGWALAEMAEDNRMLSVVAYNLAGLEFRLRNYEQARYWLERCQLAVSQLEISHELAFASHGMAVIYEEMGELNRAHEHLDRTLAILDRLEQSSPTLRGAVLATKGSVLIRQGKLGEALAVLEEACRLLEGAEIYQVNPLISTAEALCRLGRLEEAKQFHKRATDIVKKLGETVDPELVLELREVGWIINQTGCKS